MTGLFPSQVSFRDVLKIGGSDGGGGGVGAIISGDGADDTGFGDC